MPITDIKPGDEDKQGNAVCPQCGARVLIENYWGDPPKCPNCAVAYTPQYPPIKYS